MIKQGLQALAALMVFTAAPAYGAAVLDEDFQTGYGVFTPSGQVSLATGATYQPCCGTTGNTTNQFVAFGSANLPSGSIMSAAFNTVAGQLYELSFDFAALGAGSESLTFTVGTLTDTLYPVANNNLDTTFTTATYSFTGNGAMTLSFFSGGVNNVDAILDNVLITAVPELEVWAMLLFGFGAIGLQMRRRGGLRAVSA